MNTMISSWTAYLGLWLGLAAILCIGFLLIGFGKKIESKIMIYTGGIFVILVIIGFLGMASANKEKLLTKICF